MKTCNVRNVAIRGGFTACITGGATGNTIVVTSGTALTKDCITILLLVEDSCIGLATGGAVHGTVVV